MVNAPRSDLVVVAATNHNDVWSHGDSSLMLMVTGPTGHWSERSAVVTSGDCSDPVSVRVSKVSKVRVWIRVSYSV